MLLGRFEPGERIGVWAHNLPEWVVLEYGAGLAGITLVTINPSFQPAEAAYVLGQSRSAGVFLVPEVRGNPLAAHAEVIRADLPELRHVLRLDQLDDLMADPSVDESIVLARGARRRSGADPVHERHDGVPEGRRAASRERRQQRDVVGGPGRHPGRSGVGGADAAVPHRRLRDGGPRRTRPARHARAACRCSILACSSS